jgi:hypothetical protein
MKLTNSIGMNLNPTTYARVTSRVGCRVLVIMTGRLGRFGRSLRLGQNFIQFCIPMATKTAACALLTTVAFLQAFAQQQPIAQTAPAADPRTLATVEGITVGGDRRPLPGVTVTLMNDAPPNQAGLYAPSHETASDAVGRFSFQGLEPGEYRLTVERAGYFTPFGDLFKPVTLTTGQHLTGLEIHLAPEPVLSGKVTDENGEPMPGVTVRPLHIGTQSNGRLQIGSVGTLGWTYGVQTGADGEYQLTVDGNLAGRWYLSFSVKPDSHKPPSTKPASVAADGKVVPDERAADEGERAYVTTYYPGVRDLSLASGIDISAGQQVTGLNMRLQKAPVYHVRGKVAGPILPDLGITAFDESGDSHALFGDEGQPIPADGTFSFAGLTPGAWTLVLRQSPKPAFLGSRTVQVGDGDVNDVVIDVEMPVDVRGSVVMIADPSGTNARLDSPGSGNAGSANPGPLLVGPGSAYPPFSDSDRRMRVGLEPLGPMHAPRPIGARVESDGTFNLKEVAADWYRVDLSMPGALIGMPIPPPGGFVKSVTLDGRECIDSGIDLRGDGGAGPEGSSRLRITVSMTAAEIKGSVMNPDGGAPTAAFVTLMPDRPSTALYRPELHQRVKTEASGQFVVSNVVPGTYRLYAWERLPGEPGTNGLFAYADPEFLKAFDGVNVTIAESESKQVTLNLISGVRMDDEVRRHR